jgi:hypothetical protein
MHLPLVDVPRTMRVVGEDYSTHSWNVSLSIDIEISASSDIFEPEPNLENSSGLRILRRL